MLIAVALVSSAAFSQPHPIGVRGEVQRKLPIGGAKLPDSNYLAIGGLLSPDERNPDYRTGSAGQNNAPGVSVASPNSDPGLAQSMRLFPCLDLSPHRGWVLMQP